MAVGSSRRRSDHWARIRFRSQAIREWAKANGHEVSARGRIAAELVEGLSRCRRLRPVSEGTLLWHQPS
ncbi:Lsr2 family DNA-binding protein [Mycobacterium colombiense]|nr:histone-like nucleoid-structuring protein Lsr2 [Mycobacterium colombiense]